MAYKQQTLFFLTVLEAEESKIMVLVDSVSAKVPLFGS